MDQIKIGRFICELRKSHTLTQLQLADALGISDKTVSKWECGKGLPEVSLMLPLCETLGISVNELLSGERIAGADYQKKAEENMIHLIRENEESKKKFILSILIALITIIAVVALVMLVGSVAMPLAVRVLLIVLAVLTFVCGIAAACVLDRESGVFECPHCHELFVPTMGDYTKAYHTITRRSLTCPSCGKKGLCKHKITR